MRRPKQGIAEGGGRGSANGPRYGDYENTGKKKTGRGNLKGAKLDEIIKYKGSGKKERAARTEGGGKELGWMPNPGAG